MLDIPGLPDLRSGGFEPAPQPTIHHILFPDGRLSQITVTNGQEPVLVDGAKLVAPEVYEELRAKMRAAHEARVTELLAAEEDARRQQYEDLRGVGLPEATARGLSGYTGPDLSANPQAGEHS